MKKTALLVAGGVMIAGTAHAHEIVHQNHDHAHGVSCGHMAIEHEGHVDYLHDGHMHSEHGSHADEHAISVSSANPSSENLVAKVDHNNTHRHGSDGEAHMTVQHGDHIDYIHDGELHFSHGDHVDNHGTVKLITS